MFTDDVRRLASIVVSGIIMTDLEVSNLLLLLFAVSGSLMGEYCGKVTDVLGEEVRTGGATGCRGGGGGGGGAFFPVISGAPATCAATS